MYYLIIIENYDCNVVKFGVLLAEKVVDLKNWWNTANHRNARQKCEEDDKKNVDCNLNVQI